MVPGGSQIKTHEHKKFGAGHISQLLPLGFSRSCVSMPRDISAPLYERPNRLELL